MSIRLECRNVYKSQEKTPTNKRCSKHKRWWTVLCNNLPIRGVMHWKNKSVVWDIMPCSPWKSLMYLSRNVQLLSWPGNFQPLLKLHVPCRVQNSPQLILLLRQMNLFHTLILYCFKIHFINTLAITPRSPLLFLFHLILLDFIILTLCRE
jgi:hypothetical protein